MEILLIRHGKTPGNRQRRYVGRTDEGLSEEGIFQLRQRTYPPCDFLVSSPMRRCLETAEVLYGGQQVHICPGLEEMDFGEFEYKNYEELKDSPAYQRWIDGGGREAMPGGESREVFSRRCVTAFAKMVDDLLTRQGIRRAAAVVHGGTIMAVMEAFGSPRREYFQWQLANGQALALRLEEAVWRREEKILKWADTIR